MFDVQFLSHKIQYKSLKKISVIQREPLNFEDSDGFF